jgi:hypothetical protein
MAMRPPLLRGGISQMTSRAPRSSLKAPPRAEEKGGGAEHGRHHALAGLARALDHVLDGLRRRPADESLDLADDASLRGVRAEDEPGHRDADEQKGRDREDRVVRERGAETGRVVLVPVLERFLQHGEDVARSHRFLRSHRRTADQGTPGPQL